MTNTQWYERFNTKVDIYDSIGVTRQHKALLEYVVQESVYNQMELNLAMAKFSSTVLM